MKDPKKLGLVTYLGKRLASFTVTFDGITRQWCSIESANRLRLEDIPKKARWLPESEALQYHRMPQFTVAQWGTAEPVSLAIKAVVQSVGQGSGSVPPPPAEAVPLGVFLEAAAATAASLTKREEKPQSPPFIMSRAGIIHRAECKNVPKIALETFWNLSDARAHSRFKKAHRCVEK